MCEVEKKQNLNNDQLSCAFIINIINIMKLTSSDKNLMNKTKKFLKDVVFPVNQGELTRKFEAFMSKCKVKDGQIELLADLFGEISENNISTIKQTIHPSIVSYISNYVELLGASTKAEFTGQLHSAMMGIEDFTNHEISAYIASNDDKFHLLSMTELIRQYEEKLYETILQSEIPYIVDIKASICHIDADYMTKLNDTCRNGFVTMSMVNLENIVRLIEEYIYAVGLAIGTEQEYLLQAKKREINKITSEIINSLNSEFSAQSESDLEQFVISIHSGISALRESPFDRAECQDANLIPFRRLVRSTIPRPLEPSLEEDLIRYLDLCASDASSGFSEDFVKSNIDAWLFNTSYKQKVYYITSLIIVCSRAIRLIRPSHVTTETSYDPSIRHWAKELFKRMFTHENSSDLDIKMQVFNKNTFHKIENIIGKSLATWKIPYIDQSPEYTFNEFITKLEYISRNPNANLNDIIQKGPSIYT